MSSGQGRKSVLLHVPTAPRLQAEEVPGRVPRVSLRPGAREAAGTSGTYADKRPWGLLSPRQHELERLGVWLERVPAALSKGPRAAPTVSV